MRVNCALLVLFLVPGWTQASEAGPLVAMSKGQVWPAPAFEEKSEDYLIVLNPVLHFNIKETDCPFLQDALTRYWNIININRSVKFGPKLSPNAEDHFRGYLGNFDIVFNGECNETETPLVPSFDMDETYTLNITGNGNQLEADSIWGILRGLETFSQLIYQNDVYLQMQINLTLIKDVPRFPHRGLMLDTARHFIPLKLILQTLDAMSYNKLNVFHWHLTDDQSFPFVSKTYPELSEEGAYHPTAKVYQPKDVADVIEYARLRGIRVIPEFDSPSHSQSWGIGVKDLLTQCYEEATPKGFGPIDPTSDSAYKFLQAFFSEVVGVFEDPFVHFGGNDVDFSCWKSNALISTFMEKMEMSGDYPALEGYYFQKLYNISSKLGAIPIVWEQVFNNGVQLPEGAIVQVWKDSKLLNDVTLAGKQAIFSTCWDLSSQLAEDDSWSKFYQCDPLDDDFLTEQKKLVIGGEVLLWTDLVNEYNLMTKVWPRAAAAAEKLWSGKVENPALDGVARRLEEQTCRLNLRGIAAEPPNGPGVCL